MKLHVLDQLHDVYGVDTSDAAIRKAVKEHNEVCRIINEMGEMRKAENPVITGYEYAVIVCATFAAPKYLLLDKLKETLKELRPASRMQSPGTGPASLLPAPKLMTRR